MKDLAKYGLFFIFVMFFTVGVITVILSINGKAECFDYQTKFNIRTEYHLYGGCTFEINEKRVSILDNRILLEDVIEYLPVEQYK